jgi:cycloeucalenol cycloisomerase
MEVHNKWLSNDPDKRWAEKFFLIYSPVWMLQIIIAMVCGFCTRLGDVGLLFISCCITLPLYIAPIFLYPWKKTGLKWHQTYWFKADVFLTAVSIVGNYFLGEYFFDTLGMVYNFPQLKLTWDSFLLGSGTQTIPVIMYILTVAYFSTYYVTASVVLRRVRNSKYKALYPLAVLLVSVFWAFMETFSMANPMMANIFWYRDRTAMLTVGSLLYACFFVPSFPLFCRIDEGTDKWSPARVVYSGLGSYMIAMFLLDTNSRFIGHIG